MLIDSDSGKPFDPKLANVLWHKQEQAAIAALHARDEKRSGGRLCEANGWKVTVPHPERPGALIVSQELSAIKHTRREERLLAEKNWAEFCSIPQSESKLRAELAAEQRAMDIAQRQEAYDTFVDSANKATAPELQQQPLGREIEASMGDDAYGEDVKHKHARLAPKPRKRGRPPGSKNKHRKPVKTVAPPEDPDG